ncbi:MAG TPA: hypothetical protein VEJ20_05645 [Candidatus Eremiobacteraceae bacterium]|nr:hypothetical protein [Candidatus Eremiobacteraceae bacterium]
MKGRLAALSALVLAGLLFGCSGQTQSQTSATAAPATAMPAATAMGNSMSNTMMSGQALTLAMKAENGSGESGTATLTAMGPKTRVVLAITGEAATADQPAHIHVGVCPGVGAVVYPLHDVVGGKSTTIVSATIASLTASAHAINVHESKAQIGKYVSCAVIKAK